MILLGYTALLFALAQDEPASGSELTTYVITLTDGTVIHGTYAESGDQATYQIDAPWLNPPPAPVPTLRSKIADVRPELRHKREERRLKEAREAGYTRVATQDGERYIATDHLKRAERARKMADKVENQLLPETRSTAEPDAGTPTQEERTTPPPLRRYGVQVGVALAGLAISLLLLKVFVLPHTG